MQGGYNTGKDVAVDINGPYGPIRIPKIMTFESKPKTTSDEKTPLNGQTDELLIPKGWTGSIGVERVDGTLDDWWAQFEDDYYRGINQAPGTITETITNTDGSLSIYRYAHVIYKFEDAGKKEGDKTIHQTMTFTARRRYKAN